MHSAPTEDDTPSPPQPRRVSPGLLWAAVLVTVVLAIAVIVSFSFETDDNVTKISPNDQQSPLEDGETAHDLPGEQIPGLSFTRYDHATQTFGPQIGSLTDYRGAPMVLNFWASSCTPCIAEMPAIQQVADAYENRVAFLGIDQDNDPEAAAVDMINTTGVTYDIGRDDGASMLSWFGVVGLPTTVFVQADGTIAEVHVGPIDATELEAVLQEKLGV